MSATDYEESKQREGLERDNADLRERLAAAEHRAAIDRSHLHTVEERWEADKERLAAAEGDLNTTNQYWQKEIKARCQVQAELKTTRAALARAKRLLWDVQHGMMDRMEIAEFLYASRITVGLVEYPVKFGKPATYKGRKRVVAEHDTPELVIQRPQVRIEQATKGSSEWLISILDTEFINGYPFEKPVEIGRAESLHGARGIAADWLNGKDGRARLLEAIGSAPLAAPPAPADTARQQAVERVIAAMRNLARVSRDAGIQMADSPVVRSILECMHALAALDCAAPASDETPSEG